jgi:hypothetical protein
VAAGFGGHLKWGANCVTVLLCFCEIFGYGGLPQVCRHDIAEKLLNRFRLNLVSEFYAEGFLAELTRNTII